MIFYKTIPILKLFIVLICVTAISHVSFAQQSSERKNDSVIAQIKEAGLININSDLKLIKPQFSGASLLSNKFNSGDTLKKRFVTGVTGKVQDQLSAYNNLFREVKGDMKKRIENPFSLDKASMSVIGTSSNINNDSLQQHNYNLFDANISGAFIGIPFFALYQNHYYPFIQDGYQNRMSFQYDRSAYVDGIKKKLAGKFNPEDLLQSMGDPVQLLKSTAEKALSNELSSLKEQYKGLLDDKVDQLGKLENLFSKDVNVVRQSLLNNKWIEQLQTQSALLAQLQNQINTGQAVDMKQFDLLKNEVEKYKGTQAVVKIIEAHKKKWQESGLLKRIKESEFLKKDMLSKIINDPSIIRKMARQKLDLNSIQRLFLSITKLNTGQTTADFSNMLTGNSLLHGISTGFLLNSKKSIDVLAGNLRTFNSVLDLPFTNSVFNNNNRMMGFRLQNGAQGGSNSSLSFLSYQTFSGGQFPLSMPTLPRQSMIIGISRHFEINKTNNVQVELSKSSGQYMNDAAIDSAGNRHSTNDLLNTRDIGKSIAASFNYSGEFENVNLQVESFIRYAGINYDNPATGFVPAGTKEIGASIRKSFLKKRLHVYGRSNLRQYKFSEVSNNRWKNSNHFLDVRWRIGKRQSISLRYQPVRSVRIANGIKSINASTDRLAASSNISAKIKSLQYRNYFSLAYQKNIYAYQNGGNASNRSLQVSSMQSFVVGKHVLYSNTSFNKVDNASAFIFFNTSFNSDLGMAYSIGKNLSASSSVNYNSIQGWYQQIAVRQSLSGELSKKMKLDIYVDIGKNIKTFQPLPYSLFRAEWSLQYLFNR